MVTRAATIIRALGLAALLTALAACSGGAPPPPPAPEVTVAHPTERVITDWDEYSGRFEAIQSVEVRARTSGYLSQIQFQDGQIVKAGQMLFLIDPRPAQAALERARAQLQEAQTKRDLAIADLGRGVILRKERAISQEEYDQRAQAQQEGQATVAAAQAAVRSAQLDLEFTQVRSPITGRVGRHQVSIGNLVSGGGPDSTLLTTVYSLDPIYFTFDADEAAYLKYTRLNAAGERPSSRDAANPVRLKLIDETDFSHMGRMNYVDNRIDAGSGTMLGRATFANPGNLFIPGMFGRMQLLGSGPFKAILVPDAAILSDQSSKIVLTVGPGNKVVPKPVQLGSLQGDLRVIRSGLTAKDVVIVDGLVRARPGSVVDPKPATAAKPGTAK
jgi:RND family efflux transporter MFP subunit